MNDDKVKALRDELAFFVHGWKPADPDDDDIPMAAVQQGVLDEWNHPFPDGNINALLEVWPEGVYLSMTLDKSRKEKWSVRTRMALPLGFALVLDEELYPALLDILVRVLRALRDGVDAVVLESEKEGYKCTK